ncbi:MAG: hypothetical protein GXZ09_04315 [Syntrophomonadaceae bacterium]|nr:hypothetical protein [Syntrophomonadaceae bacterium]
MVILVGNWKKKLIKILAVIALIAVFAAAMPLVTGLLYEHVPAISSWFQDEQPSGNPMRVEDSEKNTFQQLLDQFVFKLQEFYYEE